MLKIATWNVNSLRVRLPHLIRWIQQENPTVLALQETKVTDRDFPLAEIQSLGYHVVYRGQPAFNGVAILSQDPMMAITTEEDCGIDAVCRMMAVTINDIRIINLYVPNGASIDSDKYFFKLNWLSKITSFLKQQLKTYPSVIVLGDFNIAPEDRDVHDPKAWEGHVLVSNPEREALRQILSAGFIDTFRLFEQEDTIFSWWDYRAGGFRRNHGLRIDLILVSHAMASLCQQCTIDKEPRSWERPSDHTPVVALFA